MDRWYKDFILPKEAKPSLGEMKEIDPHMYARIDAMLDELTEMAMNMGNAQTDPIMVKQSLIEVVDSGRAAIGMNLYGDFTVLMWNYSKGKYLPMTNEFFDPADMATVVRMSDGNHKMN